MLRLDAGNGLAGDSEAYSSFTVAANTAVMAMMAPTFQRMSRASRRARSALVARSSRRSVPITAAAAARMIIGAARHAYIKQHLRNAY
jgi:hypothetical protein